MNRRALLSRTLCVLVAAAIAPLWCAPARAQNYDDEDDYGPSRVARISFVSGDVAIYEPDANDWESVDENTPVFGGYEVYADRDARAEIALGGRSFLRIANGADVTLSQLEDGWAQISVASGTAVLSLETSGRDDQYSLSAPAAAVTPRAAGIYRVDVADNGDTWVTISRGSADVSTVTGSFEGYEGDVASVSYENPDDVDLIGDAARWNHDSIDAWIAERDDYYDDLYRSNQPDVVVALGDRDDIYGLAELIRYGSWLALDGGMYGWQPQYARDPNWAPYENGYWDYSTVSGYTWVSNEPWGWAPYHYGRWDYNDRYGWVWVPTHGSQTTFATDRTARYRWRPALVYLWQTPGTNDYAWVPLAPGERYVPFSTSTVVTPQRTTRTPVAANFTPRYLRERRGVVVQNANALQTRQKPTKVTEVTVNRVAPPTTTAASPVVVQIPRPTRSVAVAAPARTKPSVTVRKRAVVVDTAAEAKAPRPTNQADQALREKGKAERTERQAQRRQLRLERKQADSGGTTTVAPSPSRQPAATTAPPPEQPGRRGGRKMKPAAEMAPEGTPPASTTTPPRRGGRERTTTVTTEPTTQPATPPTETTTAPPAETTTAPPDSTTVPPDQRGRGKGRGKNKNKNKDQNQQANPPAPDTQPPPETQPPH
jgi:hypothetical protein